MAKSNAIDIPPIAVRHLEIEIIGTKPLITHAWSDEAKGAMRDKQTKAPKKTLKAKDKQALFEASRYYFNDDSEGFPAGAFKKAAVRAGKLLNISMTDLRQCFFVIGEYGKTAGEMGSPVELVRIQGKSELREDLVRLNGATADLRYRAEYKKWKVLLEVEYVENFISEEQVVQLFAYAGKTVGVGEWRPERDGICGTWQVGKAKPIDKSEPAEKPAKRK